MPARLLERLEVNTYLQDGKRLIYLLSLSGTEVLCEDVATGREEILSLRELSRRPWRRVQPAKDDSC